MNLFKNEKNIEGLTQDNFPGVMKVVKKVSLAAMIGSALSLSSIVSASQTSPEISPPQKMNILWLVMEDTSPNVLPVYGDNTIEMPTISQLAAEGIKYTNVYSTAGVCAPSRAGLATGIHPSSFGASHMRTNAPPRPAGLPLYDAIPPAEAKMLSQYMREDGYYTTNNYKEDYQFSAPKTAWDESGRFAHWRNRPEGQPFYAVFNFTTPHESGLFDPYGIRKVEYRHYFSDDNERIAKLPEHQMEKTTGSDTPIHLPLDTVFNIPPYLPDTDAVRRDMWKMYNNLAETDKQMAAVLQQLKDDGLYDNTIIFFYADHGGPLPRQKRLIYDSGLKAPLIIRYPDGMNAGLEDDQMISFVDFAPATMAIAGLTKPEYMHGRDFIYNTEPKRNYIYAAADRFDDQTDAIRAVKDKRFKYIRNYRPEQGYYLPIAYRERIPTMQELLRLLKVEGGLTSAQAQWFRKTKDKEELFDTLNDPHELHNLSADLKYKATLDKLSAQMDRWLADIGDQPNLPERELIADLWQGQDSKPKTQPPAVTISGGVAHISSATEGANIAYKVISNGYEPKTWLVYKAPVQLKAGEQLKAVAHRIGYQESDVVSEKLVP
ncbi:sulfatase-like hydrolase/transferase [Photobacterium sp. DNB23_23_1]